MFTSDPYEYRPKPYHRPPKSWIEGIIVNIVIPLIIEILFFVFIWPF